MAFMMTPDPHRHRPHWSTVTVYFAAQTTELRETVVSPHVAGAPKVPRRAVRLGFGSTWKVIAPRRTIICRQNANPTRGARHFPHAVGGRIDPNGGNAASFGGGIVSE